MKEMDAKEESSRKKPYISAENLIKKVNEEKKQKERESKDILSEVERLKVEVKELEGDNNENAIKIAVLEN